MTAPAWLVHQLDDLLACAVDPGCDAWDCGHRGADGVINGVIGTDKSYLCTSCLRLALDAGAIEPCPCVRCGRKPGVHMGHAAAVGAPVKVWFRVCGSCRPQVDLELGVAA